MDELDAFERQVADELALMAGGATFIDPTTMAREIAYAATRGRDSRRPGRRTLAVVGVILAIMLIALLVIALGGARIEPAVVPTPTAVPEPAVAPQPFASFAPLFEATPTPDVRIPPPPPPGG